MRKRASVEDDQIDASESEEVSAGANNGQGRGRGYQWSPATGAGGERDVAEALPARNNQHLPWQLAINSL